jgi:hypothetical protein
MPKKQQETEKSVKPTSERLSESMEILQKIKDLGIADSDPGYKALSAHFNDWIRGGETFVGTVDFIRWNRRAKVLLPTKPGAIARCDLLHYVF